MRNTRLKNKLQTSNHKKSIYSNVLWWNESKWCLEEDIVWHLKFVEFLLNIYRIYSRIIIIEKEAYTVKNPDDFPGGKHFGQPFFPAIWSPIPFDSIWATLL